MSKQTENYIGSQQHWEDRINDDYYLQKQMENKMKKDIEKQIYNGVEKQNKIILTPKEKADELFSYFYNMIQNIGGELGQEILVSILAKQSALFTAQQVLKQEWQVYNNHDLHYYWEEVEDELKKL